MQTLFREIPMSMLMLRSCLFPNLVLLTCDLRDSEQQSDSGRIALEDSLRGCGGWENYALAQCCDTWLLRTVTEPGGSSSLLTGSAGSSLPEPTLSVACTIIIRLAK